MASVINGGLLTSDSLHKEQVPGSCINKVSYRQHPRNEFEQNVSNSYSLLTQMLNFFLYLYQILSIHTIT